MPDPYEMLDKAWDDLSDEKKKQVINAHKTKPIERYPQEVTKPMDDVDLLNAANNMASAFKKLMVQLATDGIALEGFTDAWQALEEYHRLRLNITINEVVSKNH